MTKYPLQCFPGWSAWCRVELVPVPSEPDEFCSWMLVHGAMNMNKDYGWLPGVGGVQRLSVDVRQHLVIVKGKLVGLVRLPSDDIREESRL